MKNFFTGKKITMRKNAHEQEPAETPTDCRKFVLVIPINLISRFEEMKSLKYEYKGRVSETWPGILGKKQKQNF